MKDHVTKTYDTSYIKLPKIFITGDTIWTDDNETDRYLDMMYSYHRTGPMNEYYSETNYGISGFYLYFLD